MMAIPARAIHHLSETQVRCKPVVVIVGPTAAGKSRVAVEVAKAFETEVLTADSRQVYRGMDVGTDKPVPEERQGVAHRLIDLVNPDESFNAGLYRRQALDEIERLYRDCRLPLVVGGAGLYVRRGVRLPRIRLPRIRGRRHRRPIRFCGRRCGRRRRSKGLTTFMPDSWRSILRLRRGCTHATNRK